jgi:formylglycine-generating enzyme required for sulfatase activity/serine/threonine protein kinase
MASRSNQPPSLTADALFATWLARREAGEETDFERLCDEHPAHAARLRALHGHWSELDGIRRRHGLGGSLADRLKTHYGAGVDPLITLTGEEEELEVLTPEALSRLSTARYRFKGEVARGGMGAVLRVWDENLRRHLAMKVILSKLEPSGGGAPEAGELRLLARFLEEARVTGQLDHPGIVPVHDLGLDAEGRVYFTMKLVKGKTLGDVFEERARGEGGWTQMRVLGLMLKVCEAMSYAHAKGVIHRDLKPANIMVGKFGEVYVMDWGLAKILGREDEKDLRIRNDDSDAPDGGRSVPAGGRGERGVRGSSLPDSALYTMDGDVLGTPAYMPPEQAAGRLVEMGTHSDVYAVGAMLYHLLTGNMPYVPPGTKINNFEILQSARRGPPQPLHQLAPHVPAELVAICEKAMAWDVWMRYPDLSALAADLSAYIEGRVVQAYETGAWAEARKWIQRNRYLAASLAAAAVLAVAGLAGIGVVQAKGRKVAEHERGIAQQERERADEKAEEAQRSAREAQEQRMRAEGETAKVLRLSDVKVLQELEQDADALWPAHPDRIAALEDWIVRARALTSNLAGHRSTLAEMRARAQPWSAEERTADRRSHPRASELAGREAELASLIARLDQGLTGEIQRSAEARVAELEPQIADLSEQVTSRRTWSFASPEDQWQHDVLAELVAGLETFERGLLADGAITESHGWSVPRRLAFARELQARFAEDGDGAAAWAAILPDLRDRYPGLDLEPQMGLFPIGPDPQSGLFEFAHLMTGEPARRAADGTLVLTEATGVVLVLIEGGTFQMGAQARDAAGANYDPSAQEDEGPVREVRLSPYFLSKYEMTQGQWERLSGRDPSLYGPHNWDAVWLASGARGSLLHPVEQVSWLECERWLGRSGLALPSEAQWEHAARAGSHTPWWTGADKESLAGAANLVDSFARGHGGGAWAGHEMWLDDGAGVHAPVGSYAANAFGLADVVGNVFEWCLDGYGGPYASGGPMLDPVYQPAATDNRVYRGGGFAHAAELARSSTRFSNAPSLSSAYLGVRPARRVSE